MNPLDLLSIALASDKMQSVLVTLQDAYTLYNVYEKVKTAGKFDVQVMIKDGSLPTTLAAVERTAALVGKLLQDTTQGPKVVALITSIAGT